MTDINKKAAEVLVECGYADRYEEYNDCYRIHIVGTPKPHRKKVDPFYCGCELIDECIARRQADAIEDYFEQHPEIWELWNSFPRPYVYDVGESMHEWRLDRIRWCL